MRSVLHLNFPRPGTRAARFAAAACIAGALAACGSVDRTGRAFWQPYRPNVQQGNWVTQQQIALLQPGMTREQVRFALGTPTLTPVFHAERWEYPYYLKPGYGKIQERRFTVYFENDRLVRWEGDEQPRVQPFQDPDNAPAQDALQAPLPAMPALPSAETADAETPPADERSSSPPSETAEPTQPRVIQLQGPAAGPSGQDAVNPGTGSVPLR